jgi:hypothetical protein
MDQASYYCPRCQQFRLFQSTPMNHTPHILASIFLCGLWLPIWIIMAISDTPAWVCAFCGYHDLTKYLADPALKQRDLEAGAQRRAEAARKKEERKDWPLPQMAAVFVRENLLIVIGIAVVLALVVTGVVMIMNSAQEPTNYTLQTTSSYSPVSSDDGRGQERVSLAGTLEGELRMKFSDVTCTAEGTQTQQFVIASSKVDQKFADDFKKAANPILLRLRKAGFKDVRIERTFTNQEWRFSL